MRKFDNTLTIDAPSPESTKVWRLCARLMPAATEAAYAHWRTMLLWQQRAEERQRLADLSDHILRDVGLTRAEAESESDKPFWKP